MAYQSWSVVFGEQPSAAKWNILGTNDASFNDGTGLGDGIITNAKLAVGVAVQGVSQGFSAVATGSTQMVQDDTIPTNTEGNEFMTLAITPKSTTNILVIEVVAMVTVDIARTLVGAIYQDSGAALAVASIRTTDANTPDMMTLIHRMVAGTTSETTFKFRAGVNGSGTITFNGSGGSRVYGATTKSSITITEHKAS